MRFLILAAAVLGFSATAYADHFVNGYNRANGTYVQPHYQTDPNGSRFDNYSTQGNVNPYTGQAGTVNPYRQPSSGAAYGGYGVNNLNRR